MKLGDTAKAIVGVAACAAAATIVGLVLTYGKGVDNFPTNMCVLVGGVIGYCGISILRDDSPIYRAYRDDPYAERIKEIIEARTMNQIGPEEAKNLIRLVTEARNAGEDVVVAE